MFDIIAFLSEHTWSVIALLATVTMFLTGIVVNLTAAIGAWRQVIAFILAAILTVGASLAGLLTFNDPEWLNIAATSIIVGLSASGLYSVDVIKKFIQELFNYRQEIN